MPEIKKNLNTHFFRQHCLWRTPNPIAPESSSCFFNLSLDFGDLLQFLELFLSDSGSYFLQDNRPLSFLCLFICSVIVFVCRCYCISGLPPCLSSASCCLSHCVVFVFLTALRLNILMFFLVHRRFNFDYQL